MRLSIRSLPFTDHRIKQLNSVWFTVDRWHTHIQSFLFWSRRISTVGRFLHPLLTVNNRPVNKATDQPTPVHLSESKWLTFYHGEDMINSHLAVSFHFTNALREPCAVQQGTRGFISVSRKWIETCSFQGAPSEPCPTPCHSLSFYPTPHSLH